MYMYNVYFSLLDINIRKDLITMVTSLTLNYELTDSDIGYVIGDHANVSPEDLIPLYIPKIMSSIEKADETKKEIVGIDSSSYIFANAKECRPALASTIKTRNYILAKALYNCSYENGLTNGQKVSILFANDSLREIYFNTDIKNNSTESSETKKPSFSFIEEFDIPQEFPIVGKEKTLYIAKREKASYYWDSSNMKYECIGKNYEEINIINGSF